MTGPAMAVEVVRDDDGRVVAVRDEYSERRVIRGRDGRLVGLEAAPSRVDELARRVDAIASNTSDVLSRAVGLAADGWQRCGPLMISLPGVKRVAARFGLRWRIEIRWMTREEEEERDGKKAAKGVARVCGGFRDASNGYYHIVVVRKGLSADETAEVLRHELGHCLQVEILGSLFDPVYSHDGGEMLERNARRVAATVADIPLVRAVEIVHPADLVT
jgi:hypothetical protein